MVEAHRLGPRLDVRLELGELPRMASARASSPRMWAQRRGRRGTRPGRSPASHRRRRTCSVQTCFAAPTRASRGRPVPAAQTVSARSARPRRRSKQTLIACRLVGETEDASLFVPKPLNPGSSILCRRFAGGAGPLVDGFHVGRGVGRLADRDDRVDQAAPGDSEPRFLAGRRRQDPATRLDHAAIAVPHIADADLDRAVIAAARVRQPLFD